MSNSYYLKIRELLTVANMLILAALIGNMLFEQALPILYLWIGIGLTGGIIHVVNLNYLKSFHSVFVKMLVSDLMLCLLPNGVSLILYYVLKQIGYRSNVMGILCIIIVAIPILLYEYKLVTRLSTKE